MRLRNTSTILAAVMFVLTLFGSALAADKPVAQADVDKLQEHVRTIDKDLAVQKETAVIKLEALEKRQNEITAQQANSLAAISNQTTTVGNHIAMTSILITLLVAGAGLITYFSAVRKAKDEALEASKKWFDENSSNLKNKIEKLQAEATSASVSIKEHVIKVKSDADAASMDLAKQVKQASADIFNVPKTSPNGKSVGNANQQATKIVREASEALKTKPESEFTADDFYARGLADYADKNYQSALAAFKNAGQTLGPNAPAEQSARYLFAEGATLGQLDKPEQAITVYDDIDQRFGKDTAASVREQVTRALFSKGVTLGKLGKLDKSEQAIAVYDDIDQRFGKDTAAGVREQVATALFNKGITLGQLDQSEQAIAVYDDIDQRFGKDTAPGVREQVGRALNGKSFGQIMLAKKQWPNHAFREGLLESALTALPRALLQCNEDDRAMVLGNLGYAQFLSEKRQDAEISTTECLRLGGQKLLDDQLADAELHRVEPQDSDYEKMLSNISQNLKIGSLYPVKTS